MSKPVVLVAEQLAPSALEVLGQDFDVRHVDGADRTALLPAIADADAILVRSATTIDAEALEAGARLKVVARAGIGLDNVDLAEATRRGVMVVNAPVSNITSAAEHAVGLLIATARNIPRAHASLTSGEWKRSQFTGTEIADKTVGVVGLGRIGLLFAQRMSAFGARIVAYDPYVQPSRAAQIGVRMMSLDDVLAESDFISVHLPKTEETLGLIGAEALTKVKPSVIIVNAARGGIVDEQALADAIAQGRVAGAGIDVFMTEPCTESPLFHLPQVVVTPHLGASTREAQDKAGTAVARSVRLALQGEFVPDAVNVQSGGPVPEEVRPYLPLAEKLGRVFTALAGGLAASVTVALQGELADVDASVLKLAALKGVFSGVVEEPVSYVNAPLMAAARGLDVALVNELDTDFRSAIQLRGTLADGTAVSVSGTRAGHQPLEKLTEVNGYDLETALAEHMAFLTYEDRPGVVGMVGTALGEAGVNIASMQVCRTSLGEAALMVLAADGPIPAGVTARIVDVVGAQSVHAVSMPTE